MALFLEDTSKVTKKQIYIPNNAKKIFKSMEAIYEPYIDKNIDGSKIIKSLASDKQYNKKGSLSKKNGEQGMDSVSVEDAKVRVHRQDNLNPNSIEYQLYGGKLANDILKRGIESSRGVKGVETVKPPKPTSASVSNTSSKELDKEIKPQNGIMTYESKFTLKEEINDSHPIFKYFNDYDDRYVLDSFLENKHGKQNWGVLINPSMYNKALHEFSRFGYLPQFPTKYIYQWMGIIMRNTSILIANTRLAGHSNSLDDEVIEDFFLEYYNGNREVEMQNYHEIGIEIFPKEILKMARDCYHAKIPIVESNGLHSDGQYDIFFNQAETDDYDKRKRELLSKKKMDRRNAAYKTRLMNAIDAINTDNKVYKITEENGKYFVICSVFDALDDIGLYDWMKAPDGSDAFSDFGIDKLLSAIEDYNSSLPPERVLVMVNKALDVYHCRGDLASMFVEGGSKELDAIAESRKNAKVGKRIYIRENQLLKLK